MGNLAEKLGGDGGVSTLELEVYPGGFSNPASDTPVPGSGVIERYRYEALAVNDGNLDYEKRLNSALSVDYSPNTNILLRLNSIRDSVVDKLKAFEDVLKIRNSFANKFGNKTLTEAKEDYKFWTDVELWAKSIGLNKPITNRVVEVLFDSNITQRVKSQVDDLKGYLSYIDSQIALIPQPLPGSEEKVKNSIYSRLRAWFTKL